MLIKGMGELHLEIVKNRLAQDFKVCARMVACSELQVDADFGRMLVAYRESIEAAGEGRFVFQGMLAGRAAAATLAVRVEPIGSAATGLTGDEGMEFVVAEGACGLVPMTDEELEAVRSGAEDALRRGALRCLRPVACAVWCEQCAYACPFSSGIVRGYPMVGVRVIVVEAPFFEDRTPAACRLSATKAVHEALKTASSCLLEPIMQVSSLAEARR